MATRRNGSETAWLRKAATESDKAGAISSVLVRKVSAAPSNFEIEFATREDERIQLENPVLNVSDFKLCDTLRSCEFSITVSFASASIGLASSGLASEPQLRYEVLAMEADPDLHPNTSCGLRAVMEHKRAISRTAVQVGRYSWQHQLQGVLEFEKADFANRSIVVNVLASLVLPQGQIYAVAGYRATQVVPALLRRSSTADHTSAYMMAIVALIIVLLMITRGRGTKGEARSVPELEMAYDLHEEGERSLLEQPGHGGYVPPSVNILGIFAEGELRSRKPRGEKAGASTGDLTKGISFVRGQTLQPTSVPAPAKEEKEEKEAKDDDADSDVDSRFVLDASVPNGNFKPAVEGPKLPARNKLSFNQMSSSYGKGFAMLQKMGFTGGGLGKHNDGIANPIAVQKRQSKRALQDDGEMVDQDLYGNEGGRRTVEELLSVGRAPEKKSTEPKISDGWKRDGKPKKQKTIYKTAEENAGEVPAMRIVDMRGPEVKVASSFAELAANLSGDSVRSLKEFRHNTRLLVSRYEDKVRLAAERKRHCENVILSAAKEQERLQAADNISEADELVVEIESLRERQDEGSIGLSELAETFHRLDAWCEISGPPSLQGGP
eukprot:s1320_g20.t1